MDALNFAYSPFTVNARWMKLDNKKNTLFAIDRFIIYHQIPLPDWRLMSKDVLHNLSVRGFSKCSGYILQLLQVELKGYE